MNECIAPNARAIYPICIIGKKWCTEEGEDAYWYLTMSTT